MVKDFSSEYGVSETTIYTWVKKLKPIELDDGKSITQDDYVKLQKELNRIERGNLLAQDFTTATLNEIWVADIT